MKTVIGVTLSDQVMVNMQTYRKHEDRFLTTNKFFTLQKDFPVIFLQMTSIFKTLVTKKKKKKTLVTFQNLFYRNCTEIHFT